MRSKYQAISLLPHSSSEPRISRHFFCRQCRIPSVPAWPYSAITAGPYRQSRRGQKSCRPGGSFSAGLPSSVAHRHHIQMGQNAQFGFVPGTDLPGDHPVAVLGHLRKAIFSAKSFPLRTGPDTGLPRRACPLFLRPGRCQSLPRSNIRKHLFPMLLQPVVNLIPLCSCHLHFRSSLLLHATFYMSYTVAQTHRLCKHFPRLGTVFIPGLSNGRDHRKQSRRRAPHYTGPPAAWDGHPPAKNHPVPPASRPYTWGKSKG